MPTVTERVVILETKVENIDVKIDDLKVGVKDMHDCLDRTGESLHLALKDMADKSAIAHGELSKKISELEKFKAKWTYLILGGIAAFSWIAGHLSAFSSFFK